MPGYRLFHLEKLGSPNRSIVKMQKNMVLISWAIALSLAVTVLLWTCLDSNDSRIKNLIVASCIQADLEGVVMTESLEKIIVSWKVSNVSPRPISGCYVQVGCPCDIVQGFPHVLQANEECIVSYRLESPECGVQSIALPIIEGMSRDNVGCLKVTLSNQIKAPYWIAPPTEINLLSVASTSETFEVTWIAIEHAGTLPQVAELKNFGKLPGAMCVDLQIADVPLGGSFVKRRYECRFEGECGVSIGEVTGFLRLLGNSGNELSSIPWTIVVKPAVSVIPERVCFDNESGGAVEVDLVSRVGPLQFVNVQSNSEFLRVESLADIGGNASVRRFRISTIASAPQVADEKIVFQCADVSCELPVQFK